MPATAFDRIDEFARDVRVGFRGLRRDRLFAVSAIALLALGIGTSVAMFSVLHAVVLRPLPYARPGELTVVSTHLMAQNRWDGTSMLNLLDWRSRSRAFAAMTFYRRTVVSVVTFAGAEAPQRAQEGLVGPEFFDLLGAPALAGRPFSRDEFERRERVVVLSEGLWREQFAGRTSAVGQSIVVDGAAHTIVGVMPRTFQLPTSDTRFWRPLALAPAWDAMRGARDGDNFEVIGRLAPGATLDQAQAEMRTIAAQLREEHRSNRNLDVRVTALADRVVTGQARRGLWLGFAAVLSLLAIACANVGGLLSARAARRRREFAVRTALGAGRARLVRQLLAEGVCLWTAASAAGLLLAYGLLRLLLAYGPAFPRVEEASLDATALAIALAGGLVVVAVIGTLPALTATRAEPGGAVGARDASGLPRHRLHDALVTAQIAVALVLLVGAVLFARSFLRAQRENPGYPAEQLLIARVDLPRAAYPDRPALARFFHEAQDRLARLPGVVAVGGMTDFFIRRNADQSVTIEGRAPEAEAPPRLAIEGVTPGYFQGVGIDVVSGRDFEMRDYEERAPPVVVVSDAVARRFWPGDSAIGKRLTTGTGPPRDGRWSTVVGVVRDFRREGLDVKPILLVFLPSYLRGMDLTIRAATASEALVPAVRGELRAIDPALPIAAITTAQGRLSERLGSRRFEGQVLGLFAAIAVALSAAGLYALLAYQVTVRTRELGIRSALGADRRAIVAMVVGQGLRLALAGAAIGAAGAASLARVLQSMLYDTPALQASSYAAAVALVLLTAAAAASLPAWRAARISPMTALREE